MPEWNQCAKGEEEPVGDGESAGLKGTPGGCGGVGVVPVAEAEDDRVGEVAAGRVVHVCVAPAAVFPAVLLLDAVHDETGDADASGTPEEAVDLILRGGSLAGEGEILIRLKAGATAQPEQEQGEAEEGGDGGDEFARDGPEHSIESLPAGGDADKVGKMNGPRIARIARMKRKGVNRRWTEARGWARRRNWAG